MSHSLSLFCFCRVPPGPGGWFGSCPLSNLDLIWGTGRAPCPSTPGGTWPRSQGVLINHSGVRSYPRSNLSRPHPYCPLPLSIHSTVYAPAPSSVCIAPPDAIRGASVCPSHVLPARGHMSLEVGLARRPVGHFRCGCSTPNGRGLSPSLVSQWSLARGCASRSRPFLRQTPAARPSPPCCSLLPHLFRKFRSIFPFAGPIFVGF